MDLRGFSKKNAGCIFEIKTLLDAQPHQKILYIIDKRTSESFFKNAFSKIWDHLYSNDIARSTKINFIKLKGTNKNQIDNIISWFIKSTSS